MDNNVCTFRSKLCVALSMANPDLEVRLGGYVAARLAATTKPLFFVIKLTRCTNFSSLFWHDTLHISGSSSARNM